MLLIVILPLAILPQRHRLMPRSQFKLAKINQKKTVRAICLKCLKWSGLQCSLCTVHCAKEQEAMDAISSPKLLPLWFWLLLGKIQNGMLNRKMYKVSRFQQSINHSCFSSTNSRVFLKQVFAPHRP